MGKKGLVLVFSSELGMIASTQKGEGGNMGKIQLLSMLLGYRLAGQSGMDALGCSGPRHTSDHLTDLVMSLSWSISGTAGLNGLPYVSVPCGAVDFKIR